MAKAKKTSPEVEKAIDLFKDIRPDLTSEHQNVRFNALGSVNYLINGLSEKLRPASVGYFFNGIRPCLGDKYAPIRINASKTTTVLMQKAGDNFTAPLAQDFMNGIKPCVDCPDDKVVHTAFSTIEMMLNTRGKNLTEKSGRGAFNLALPCLNQKDRTPIQVHAAKIVEHIIDNLEHKMPKDLVNDVLNESKKLIQSTNPDVVLSGTKIIASLIDYSENDLVKNNRILQTVCFCKKDTSEAVRSQLLDLMLGLTYNFDFDIPQDFSNSVLTFATHCATNGDRAAKEKLNKIQAILEEITEQPKQPSWLQKLGLPKALKATA